MSNEQIVAEYIGNATMEQTVALAELVKARRKALLNQAATANTLNLTAGSRARLTNIRPKYLDGQTVVIRRRTGTKFLVDFEDGATTGRFGPSVNVSASCLVPI